MFQQISWYQSVVFDRIWWMHVGFWGRILYNSRLPVAWLLYRNTIFLHTMFHVVIARGFDDIDVSWMFTRQWPIYFTFVVKWSDISHFWLMWVYCMCNFRMLWRFERLDAQLGTQQHGMGLCFRSHWLIFTLSRRSSISRGRSKGEISSIKWNRESWSECIQYGNNKILCRRSHRHLKHGKFLKKTFRKKSASYLQKTLCLYKRLFTF